jgi:biotin synthase
MRLDPAANRILDAALEGVAPTQDQCASLLGFPELSPEAARMRAVADGVSRARFGNAAIILGQIGVEIDACPGRCAFCSFGEGHTAFAPSRLSDADIRSAADGFAASGALFALFLMTMHAFDGDRLARIVTDLRGRLPANVQLVANIGDFDRTQALELKAAGINGAYHVLRLREGTDTALDPTQRKATIRTIRECGLDWYYCCEPIGPEHTPQELAEQIYLGIAYGCFQHAAMRRVFIPSSPLAPHGQISELHLAQVVAAVTLATLACPETRSIAVHEPNLLGLCAGANTIYAEAGANPRDTQKETNGHRGRDIKDCKRMLYEAGFAALQLSPRKAVPLGAAYRE